MKKIPLSLLTDTLFYAVCAFMLSLCVLRYYRVGFGASAALAAMFAVAAGGICFILFYGSYRKRFLGRKESERRDALLLHLALERPERVRAALLQAFVADGRRAHLEKDALTVDDMTVIPMFTMQPVSADDAARILREFAGEPFSIACNALSPETEKLLSSFGITCLSGDEIYDLFRRTDTMPESLICGKIPRRTVKTKLRRSFSKKNARPFLVSGLVLLVMSLFTVFPVYYLITGCVLLVSAVAVRLFGYA